jgi:hypothetical protein
LVEGVEDFEEGFVGEGQEVGLVGVWLVRGGVVVAWIGMVGVVVGCGWFGLVDERCDV